MTIQVLNEIRALAGSGVDIGSHTVNHLWLGKTKDSVVIKELQDSKKALEDILGQEVPHFAYIGAQCALAVSLKIKICNQ